MTKTPTKRNIASTFSIRVINKFNIGLVFVFFIFTNLSTQKWCNHISSVWSESVLEKENKNARQNFASKTALLKKLTHKELLYTSKDSPYPYE